MNKIHFYKYQGTGNDFIIIDNRNKDVVLTTQQIALFCHPKWGIGADGLMLLENHVQYDFKMIYYNADGSESSMCGNGGRCISAFANKLNIGTSYLTFEAIDGIHYATIEEHGIVNLKMSDVSNIKFYDTHVILNTGSPHYIVWTTDVDRASVVSEGRKIRNLEEFAPKGINVNFVQKMQNHLKVRTYERGVENETLSCGTGVTAAAIASTEKQIGEFTVLTHSHGGNLTVSFEKKNFNSAINVFLKGPATFVFEGDIKL